MKKIAILLTVFMSFVFSTSSLKAEETNKQVDLLFFWGDGCPHCAEAKPFLGDLEARYPELKVHAYETWENSDNAKLFQNLAAKYGVKPSGVPAFFIGDERPIFGYTQLMQPKFFEKIEKCLNEGCPNPLDRLYTAQEKTKVVETSVAEAEGVFEDNLYGGLHKAIMYFFWGDGCPHCAEAKPFLEELKKQYPSFEIHSYETWKNQEGAKIFQDISSAYNVKPLGVPAFFIGDKSPIFGFTEDMKGEITSRVQECLGDTCVNPAVKAGLIDDRKLCIHLFYRPDCPHCIRIQDFLSNLETNKYVEIYRHNVYEENENALFDLFKEKYGLTQVSYPVVFVGSKYFVGERSIKDNLEKTVDVCLKKDCHCPAENVLGSTPIIPRAKEITPDEDRSITLPFFGEVNLADSPIIITTSIIAFVDGFNPCSTWLIMFLLGMVIHTRSRKKVLMVSLTFLSVTAAAYGAFMLGILNVFAYVGYIEWIQISIAMLALLFAVVNIKDYFWFKKGLSFTISDKHKPGIFKDMRNIIKPDKSTFAMITATSLLALGVVLVELPCTAGFPVIWANLLARNNVHGMYFACLFVIYIFIYLLDELVLIISAVITLKTNRFEEKHGRVLKLIGGLVMAFLAIFMIFSPETLNSLMGTVKVFGAAGLTAWLIIIIHKKILPKFGINIGSDEDLS
ncbi:MAG: hypothetical protein AB7U85_05550 [Alphaproteobacteria bacterium]